VIVLSQRDVAALLSMRDCIDVMGRALTALTRGESVLPLRTVFRLPSGTDFFALMPAYIGPGGAGAAAVGAKVITVVPGNHGTERDSHQGAVLLFDTVNGSLLAVLDATSITSIRTAAVSALATKHLARADADDLAILGSGVQARTHLEAIPLVRRIRRVRVWSRDATRARMFVDSMAGRFPDISVSSSAEAAVRDASIVCTVTSSTTPVLEGKWLADGAHVNVVGAATPRAREVDSETIVRSRVFVDRRESALAEAGDILIPISEGAITGEHIVAELGEIVGGARAGRESVREITLFKSLGLAVEDIAAAQHVFSLAVERRIGTDVALGGFRNADA
jgi:ornithine cyclodeaminase